MTPPDQPRPESAVDAAAEATAAAFEVRLDRIREANEHLILATVHAQAKTEEADQANRLKDQFLAIVSHELRTPLNVILGWAKMLASGQLKAARTAHAIATIERNASGLARQIDDLLDVSRMIAGSLRLDRQPVDLLAVVRAACDVVSAAASAKQVSLECDCGPAAQTSVDGDAGRLQQILVNLLSNAVMFTPTGGHVSVCVHVERPMIHIEVKDSGAGITAEFLPHVFERFSQESQGSTRRTNGLGLGLAIVKQLVELHGGSVQAESAGENLGACFTVRLPIGAASYRGPSLQCDSRNTSEDTLARLDGVRVLIVEDHTDGRELLVEVLQAAGARVVEVSSVIMALEAFAANPFDVLLSDIGLEESDGYTLIRCIRQLEQQRGGFVPAIALTGFAFPDDRERALNAGFQSHVAKPIEPRALTAAIADLLSLRG